jgi:hypothetical protein
MDFAPTICQILGVDLPDADGHPIPEVVGSEVASVAEAGFVPGLDYLPV